MVACNVVYRGRAVRRHNSFCRTRWSHTGHYESKKYVLFFPDKYFWRVYGHNTFLQNTTSQGCTMPFAKSPRRRNLLWWRFAFLGTQYGTFFMSLFWRPKLSRGTHIFRNLTFRGPCTVIHSYKKKPTRCTISHVYLIKYSTCFGQVHCPSSGVSQHCIHAIGICHASSVGCLLAWSPR